jgi:hypothetical protein
MTRKTSILFVLVFAVVVPGTVFAGGSGEGDLEPLKVMIVERESIPDGQGSIKENPWTEYVRKQMAELAEGVA